MTSGCYVQPTLMEARSRYGYRTAGDFCSYSLSDQI